LQNLSVILSNIHNYINMARSKATARKPKGSTDNQKEIKAGRVEKPEIDLTKNQTSSKVAAKKATGNEKTQRPISKKKKMQYKAARASLASGELASEDQVRRKERDLRTLYIRFKDIKKLPESPDVVKSLHEDIQDVRINRNATDKNKRVRFAYVEFSSEAKCDEAKPLIQKKEGLYVDYVGEKSKNGGKPKGGKGKNFQQINPTRLFITGLVEGMTDDKLKKLFPKCCKAEIPKGSKRKGNLYGFVQFDNPADAKSAFEAAKKLTVQSKEGKGAQRITVLYAKVSKHPAPRKSTENSGQKKEKNKENNANNILDTKNEVKDEDDQVESTQESDNEGKDEKNDEESEDEGEELENDADSEDDQEMKNDEESDDADNADSNDESEADIDESGDSD